MTCDSHTNLIPELQFFMILIPIPIPLGLIPILIPIPGFIKINDLDSSTKWFWFRFQCFPKDLIPILIPIPVSFDFDSDSDSSKPGFDSDSDSGIWLRFRNHLQLWYKSGLACLFSVVFKINGQVLCCGCNYLNTKYGSDAESKVKRILSCEDLWYSTMVNRLSTA